MANSKTASVKQGKQVAVGDKVCVEGTVKKILFNGRLKVDLNVDQDGATTPCDCDCDCCEKR